ncbi:MAG TPA: DapH/DapD/GlmU-related protein [Hanamia sp.]|nr:DapH/DapD/GlmU-related protein [Hanamia sp.]
MSAFLKKFFKAEASYSYPGSKNFKKLPFSFLGEGSNVMAPFLIKNHKYISIGKNFTALYNLRIEAWDEFAGERFSPKIIIGNDVIFNSDVHIGCIDRVQIGDNVLMASRIFITDHSHGEITKEAFKIPPGKRSLVSKGPVIIKDNVWIGEGVSILSGVTIGKNSIIGANAVVTKSIPPNCVAGGIPCRILKELN